MEHREGEENSEEIEQAWRNLVRWNKNPLAAHADGYVEGLQDGHREGRYMTLRRLLKKRFGLLPEDVEERLTAARERDLDRWLDRLLTAPTLADVLKDAADE